MADHLLTCAPSRSSYHRVKPKLLISTFTFSYQARFSKVSVVFHWPQWNSGGAGGENNLSAHVFGHHSVGSGSLTSKLRPFMLPSLQCLTFYSLCSSQSVFHCCCCIRISAFCLHPKSEHSWLHVSLIPESKPIHVSWMSSLPRDLLN